MNESQNKIDDGGAAFPRPASEYTEKGTLHDGNDAVREQDGMTLRDHFAAKAMQAILSSGTIGESENLPSFVYSGDRLTWNGMEHPNRIGEMSYQMADAMLRARKQVQP